MFRRFKTSHNELYNVSLEEGVVGTGSIPLLTGDSDLMSVFSGVGNNTRHSNS